jgi:peptide/nickel transport system substrate-binding protein
LPEPAMCRSSLFVLTLLAALALAHVAPLRAQERVIGLSSLVTSLDPHVHNRTPNDNVADHVVETLVGKDAKEALERQLAAPWRSVNEDPLGVQSAQGGDAA